MYSSASYELSAVPVVHLSDFPLVLVGWSATCAKVPSSCSCVPPRAILNLSVVKPEVVPSWAKVVDVAL